MAYGSCIFGCSWHLGARGAISRYFRLPFAHHARPYLDRRRDLFARAAAGVAGLSAVQGASAKAGQFSKLDIFSIAGQPAISSPYQPGGPQGGGPGTTYGYKKSDGPILADGYKVIGTALRPRNPPRALPNIFSDARPAVRVRRTTSRARRLASTSRRRSSPRRRRTSTKRRGGSCATTCVARRTT